MTLYTKFGNIAPKTQQTKFVQNIGEFFISYGSKIALYGSDGQIYLDSYYWDYSNTTGYYLNQFLNVSGRAEIRKGIETGIYILTDLNNQVYFNEKYMYKFEVEKLLPMTKRLNKSDVMRLLGRYNVVDLSEKIISNKIKCSCDVWLYIWNDLYNHKKTFISAIIEPIFKRKRFKKTQQKNVFELLESPNEVNKTLAFEILKLCK